MNNKNKNSVFFPILQQWDIMNMLIQKCYIQCWIVDFLDQLEKLYICKLGVNPLNLPFNHKCFEIIDCGIDLKTIWISNFKKIKRI